ncbi:3-carboxyethylcatechol 2,3-dioxygenase [Rhodococcus sp. ABRD24]|uniref:3-carboxyethylcatechol 2,3-dioxygenase n=1 Tax=Rhodococcus sp. ABRD24 TaxID=2507582 RepID=UPI00103B65B3|nr:3-carboxyethylcatechol 2,3-dioxygenase [Rhodococcus sp. ABRD24]QBJ95486.1 3-carboxyethylcatechol 2,3-dioxygenase [Rhodococcus sp. ABRD24]
MTVALVALSHSPLIGLNDPDQEVLDEVDHAVAGARTFIEEFDPEIVVLFAPDHYNGFFYEKMPPFAIATGAIAVGDFGSAEGEILVDAESANAMAEGVLERDIDLTISARMVVDHGFVQPLEMLFGGIRSVPVVPVFINGVAAPLGPVRRIRQFGKALGEAARLLDKRVLFLASGGLSHDPPVPILAGAPPRVAEALILGNPPTPEQRARGEQRVVQSGIDLAAGTSTRKPLNPEWDNDVLDIVAAGDLEVFDGWTNEFFEEQAGGSSHEVRTWIAAYAALAASGSYEVRLRYYRPIPEWVAGFAVTTAR